MDSGLDRPHVWSAPSGSHILDVVASGLVVETPGSWRLTIRTRLHPRGPLRVATPLLASWMHRTWDRDGRAVKATDAARGRP
jgi:hypothetical protein